MGNAAHSTLIVVSPGAGVPLESSGVVAWALSGPDVGPREAPSWAPRLPHGGLQGSLGGAREGCQEDPTGANSVCTSCM
eukprot:6219994-Pyramimonas_sp.AAC.1